MKEPNTIGVVRRIDDLGRIAIPKEVRKSMGLVEGDPIEFFNYNGYLCLQKYEVPKTEDLMHKLIDITNFIENNIENMDGDYLEDLHKCITIATELYEEAEE